MNAELAVAFAMLNLANLTHDYGVGERHRKSARDYYYSVKESLKHSELEVLERDGLCKRLDEVRE